MTVCTAERNKAGEVSHRARWKIDNEKQMPIESRRAVERGRRDRSKKRQKERKGGGGGGRGGNAYLYTDTPGLETFSTKFSRKTPNILNKTLLIVTRKGGRKHTARLARHSHSQPHIDDENAKCPCPLVRRFRGAG